ncbi:MAG: Rpn family recombination-promoting nuclease/putative transposase [Myxococcota bacterium]
MSRLDPKLDLVFKLLLTRGQGLLVDMLQGVLGRPVRSVEIINPRIPGELSTDKAIILDIRAKLDDGARVDVEMQLRTDNHLAARMTYYGARDYTTQLVRGDDYDQLRPTAVILWLLEPLFPDLDQLHSIFELRERHTNRLLTDQLAIHVLQLSCLSESKSTEDDARVRRWARFFTAKEDADFDKLAAEDPIMAVATQTLDQLSQDPDVRQMAQEREHAQMFYRMELATSRQQGIEQGIEQGRSEMLLELLELRFGSLSDTTRAQINTASPQQLRAWTRQVLTANTLDNVFAA